MRINNKITLVLGLFCYSSAFAMPLFSKSYTLANIQDALVEYREAGGRCEGPKVQASLDSLRKKISKADSKVNKTLVFHLFSQAITLIPSRCEPAKKAGEDLLIELEITFVMGAKDEIAKLGGRSPSLTKVLEKNRKDIEELGQRLGVLIDEEKKSDRMMKSLEERMRALNEREAARSSGGAGSAK